MLQRARFSNASHQCNRKYKPGYMAVMHLKFQGLNPDSVANAVIGFRHEQAIHDCEAKKILAQSRSKG
jgi:hypothetical protein